MFIFLRTRDPGAEGKQGGYCPHVPLDRRHNEGLDDGALLRDLDCATAVRYCGQRIQLFPQIGLEIARMLRAPARISALSWLELRVLWRPPVTDLTFVFVCHDSLQSVGRWLSVAIWLCDIVEISLN